MGIASDDTIAAIATPVGAGGIGVVRVSGPSAVDIVARLAGRKPDQLEDRKMYVGRVTDQAGEFLDEVLFVVMRGPRSFTGEDVGEIHGHGGVANMSLLLRSCLAAGARLAEPGEFSRRAFHSGRLDLTRAEGILGVIQASSERALRQARSQLRGDLGAVIASIREKGIGVQAVVEASVDFPEEGLEAADRPRIDRELSEIIDKLDALLNTAQLGRALRDGITVALTGAVNAGKSSLLNALVGQERALVATEPGTTRDYVEASVVWEGVTITLVDTAGERAGAGAVEERGIELGRARAADADVELVLVAPGEDARESGDPRVVWVASKSDLRQSRSGFELETSVVTGQGLAELKTEILRRAIGEEVDAAGSAVVTNERQRDRLQLARDSFATCREMLEESPLELAAVELHCGNRALAECLGEEVADEVLDEIFARFCIGK